MHTHGLIGLILLCWFSVITSALAAPASIAASSNVKFALDEIANAFSKDTGSQVNISYGSSGNLVTQIKHGAPFELFLSADDQYIQQLQSLGLINSKVVEYAIGKLALAVPISQPLDLDKDLSTLKVKLLAGELRRFAIANPVHAPYGERAKEYLQHLELWDLIKPRLIFAENASQAAQFAISGSTQGGIVPLSLIKSKQFQSKANFIELTDKYHRRLSQQMVLLPNADRVAQLFFHYLQTDKAKQIFHQYGFGLPAEQET